MPGRIAVVVVVDVPERLGTGWPGDVIGVCVKVVGGSGPGPSGSTTVVAVSGALVVGVPVPLVVSVGVVDSVVEVSVVLDVLGVLYVVFGRVSTLVRGTQVYSGSGTYPGGTT
ncbi:hypothetical protein H7J06_10155 [Mycobacterium hodleri]|nr:hypothetical protein [Mycolicibacterium hodleri]MCV7133346.1 hypothetical protein [Mycolicibacterium hodleri]